MTIRKSNIDEQSLVLLYREELQGFDTDNDHFGPNLGVVRFEILTSIQDLIIHRFCFFIEVVSGLEDEDGMTCSRAHWTTGFNKSEISDQSLIFKFANTFLHAKNQMKLYGYIK